jgi:hypothetical protein
MYNAPSLTISEHVFAFKIGTSLYSPTNYTGGGATRLTQETVSHVNTGTMQHISKKYSGTYNSQPFSVTWTIRYNTSNPDFLTMEATIDTRNIPVTPIRIRLAYGFDAYVNGCDAGAAYVLPDILNKNGTPNSSQTNPDWTTMTKAQVRQLNLVATKNTFSSGSLMGFFPMGRQFDFANAEGVIQAYGFIDAFNRPDISYFRFGEYDKTGCATDGPWDSGIAVNYDSIPAGQITTIRTGMTFTQDLLGTLNYSWKTNDWSSTNDTIVQVAAGGSDLNLRLRYDSYSPSNITNIVFNVDLPQALTTSAPASQTGFTYFDTTVLVNTFLLNSASIGTTGSIGYITLPVHLNSYGQFTIDANSISNASKTLPIGDPAILTANTQVDFATQRNIKVAAGNIALVKVKLPDGVVANGDLTVNLDYSAYDPLDFAAALPASVTILDGTNEATVAIQSLSTATAGNFVEISLTATDSQFVSVAASKAKVTIKSPRYVIPVNPN